MHFDYDFTLLLLIFMRMSGCILFNPIFGRKNIPIIVKVGLTLILSLFVYNFLPNQTVELLSPIEFGVSMVSELCIGFIIGFIIQMFLSVLILGGEFMDLQIGISMAKIYDPQSNVSMPLTATILNIMFMLIFFISNAHLTLIKIFTYSCSVIPYGEFSIQPDVFKAIAQMFSLMLIYSVKLSLPLLAVEMIAEIGVGLIMKAVPQINVFVVNLQLKILLGFAVILIMVGPFASFLERLITLMFDNINKILGMII